MSAQAPTPTPAPSGALPGMTAQASSMSAPRSGMTSPYPRAHATGTAGDRFGYAPTAPTPIHPSITRFPGTEYVNLRAVFADGGYTSPKPITNPLARAALWVSVFSVFFIPIIVSVVLAIIALVQAQNLPGRVGAREAIAALVYSSILILGAVILYLIGLSLLF